MRAYLTRVLLAADRLGNAVLGGSDRETVSFRCHRSRCKACAWLCGALSKISKAHCEQAKD